VDVILDEREARHPSEASALATLASANVTTLLDGAHSIAHNKIVIIDNATIITGSFNFSIAAERENAENVAILRHCPNLAHLYLSNFQFHFSHSHPR
jgi:phosphatidylserine/phosphatidylglycerophosphate/cardiolipin synthase-like enzyme